MRELVVPEIHCKKLLKILKECLKYYKRRKYRNYIQALCALLYDYRLEYKDDDDFYRTITQLRVFIGSVVGDLVSDKEYREFVGLFEGSAYLAPLKYWDKETFELCIKPRVAFLEYMIKQLS